MQQWPEEVEQDALPPPPPEDWAGKRVELHGLKGAAEFNGREGVVKGPMDSTSLRYEVLLDPLKAEEEPAVVKVKAANLKPEETLEAGRKVTIQGLVSKAELNGCKGVVESFDKTKGRYNVKVDSTGQVLALKISNLDAQAFRPTALSARPGKYKASYDWREVMEGQELPPGMEMMCSLEEDVPNIARIPHKWKLEVRVTGPDGSNSAAHDPFRMDVHGDGTGAGTSIGEIQETLRDWYRPDKRAVTGW
jgi:hypothetical protein